MFLICVNFKRMKFFIGALILLSMTNCKPGLENKTCIDYNEKINLLYTNVLNYCKTKESLINSQGYKIDSNYVCRELFKTEHPFEMLIRKHDCVFTNLHYKSNFNIFNLYREKISALDLVRSFNNPETNSHSTIVVCEIDTGFIVNNKSYNRSVEVTIMGDNNVGPNFIRATLLIPTARAGYLLPKSTNK